MSGRYALMLFSLVYLAGIVAAVYQLVLGTAAKAFPRWLAGWLSMRKQLGLIALLVTVQHIIVCCFLPVPGNMIDVGLNKLSTKMNRYWQYQQVLYSKVPCYTLLFYSVNTIFSAPN